MEQVHNNYWMADDENFRGTFDTTRYKAAIHFFTTESLGMFTVPHLTNQFSYMINFALYSKKQFPSDFDLPW